MTLPPPLPVTVVSGYLGAGKTTLINHVLRHADGRRIMVLVNDFGDLDIDADLLESADEDTLTLSNGCICCTMGLDFLYALADACDRRPRPDALLIEASGVAEPEKIAAAAEAEPEMAYGGIVTLADVVNIADRLGDPRVGAQVAGQIRVADLLVLTKPDLGDAEAVEALLATLSSAPVMQARDGALPVDLLLGPVQTPRIPDGGASTLDHGVSYVAWSRCGGRVFGAGLETLLQQTTPGLYRLKGWVETDTGPVEVQRAGRVHTIRPCDAIDETRIVGIGVSGLFDLKIWDAAWDRIQDVEDGSIPENSGQISQEL